jgi:hypothetical protein
MSEKLTKGHCYHWREIEALVGHEPCGYLTQVGQNIVCGCFRKEFNPDAPTIVLPGGKDPQWIAKAQLFQRQGTAIPIFVNAEGSEWEFVGRFRVKALTQELREIQIQKDRYPKLQDIGAVLLLSEE